MRRMLVVLGSAFLAAACGGSATGPSDVPPVGPAKRTLSFFNGLDWGVPMVGAQVTVDSKSFVTNASGQIEVEGMTSSSMVDVVHQGCLVMNTTPAIMERFYGKDRFGLWQAEDKAYVQALVFHQYNPGQRLVRPDPGTFTYSFSSEIGGTATASDGDQEAVAHLEHAMTRISVAASGKITFSKAAPGQDAHIKFVIDANDPNPGAGLTYLSLAGYRIKGARIVFRNLEVAKSTTAQHELGHFLGLGHSKNREDLMFFSSQVENFTGREIGIISMMAQRLPGTAFEDNSRMAPVAASSEAVTEVVISCK